jgi:uncharacterized Zn-binding protein involved in type VI secretion
MPAVQRQGDPNSRGGVITSGDASVRVNGRAIAVKASPVSPHPCCGSKGCPPTHCNAITTGSSSVRVNGRPVTLSSDPDSCGDPRTSGSSNVFAR